MALRETDPADLASLAQRHASLGRHFHALRSYARAPRHKLPSQTWLILLALAALVFFAGVRLETRRKR